VKYLELNSLFSKKSLVWDSNSSIGNLPAPETD